MAITIASDGEWSGFCEALGNPAWTKDPRFATFAGRRENHRELDEYISEWTSQHDRYEAMDRLQRAGIAASAILYPCETLNDPHFVSRGFFEPAEHPYSGRKLLPGRICKMSESDCRTRFPAPCLGQHNRRVFQDLLGLSDEEISVLTQAGAIGTEPQFRE